MSRRVRLGVLGVVAAVIVSSCGFNSVYDVPLPGGADVGSNPTTLTIEFEDVLDLVPESAVKVDDVTVGKVTDIEIENWTAVVTVKIRNSVDLPSNATASIRQTSILGEKFVSLEKPPSPASGELASGDDIPLARTGRSPEIEEVLGALSMVLNGGSVSQLQTISKELDNIFAGREGEVRSVIRRLGKLMGDIDRSRPELVEALQKIDRLGRNANDQTDAIDAALRRVPNAVKVLDDQRDEFVQMLGKLKRFGDIGTSIIRKSRRDTVANLRDLQPILTNLNRSGDALVKSLRLLLTAPYPDSLVGETPEEARAFTPRSFINTELSFNPELPKILDDLSPVERRSLQKLLRNPSPYARATSAPGSDDRIDGLSRLMMEAGEAP